MPGSVLSGDEGLTSWHPQAAWLLANVASDGTGVNDASKEATCWAENGYFSARATELSLCLIAIHLVEEDGGD